MKNAPSICYDAPVRLIDLFAGCGGLTQGFVDAGFEPVFAVESNRHAAATYRANFGDHVECTDIAMLDSSDLPGADVVVGGPPCQGFSNLGTRDPDDPRNHLLVEYLRVVEAVRPAVFVIENVPTFLKSPQFRMLEEAVSTRPLSGYRIEARVVNAADYGVAQRRLRAIVIGSRVGEPVFPERTHGPGTSQPWATLGDVLQGIPFDVETARLPGRWLDDGIPGPFKAPELHLSRNPTPLSLERYDHIPPGGNRFDLPDDLKPPCWLNKPSGTSDVMGRLEWEKPALTIRTEFWKPEKGRSLHPEWPVDDPERRVNRPITHWEAARIQSFPDDFVWCGSRTEIARQIGNAVPPRFAEALARAIGLSLTSSTR